MECMGKENYEKVQEIELPEMMLVCCSQLSEWGSVGIDPKNKRTWLLREKEVQRNRFEPWDLRGRTPSLLQTHQYGTWEARVRRCEKVMTQELIFSIGFSSKDH